MKVVVQCYRVYKVYIYIPINIYIHIIYIKYKYYVGNCFLCFVRFLYPPCGFHIVTCIGKLLQGPGYYFFMFFFSATKDSRRWHITVIYIHIHKRAHCCKTIAAWCSFSTCDVPCICPASLPSPERENRSKPVRQSYSRVVWKARRCLSLGRLPLCSCREIVNCDARAELSLCGVLISRGMLCTGILQNACAMYRHVSAIRQDRHLFCLLKALSSCVELTLSQFSLQP